MLELFILRALAAGIAVALIASVIGCFVVWRRMAYFGDGLAHSALLGIALGIASGLSPNLGTIFICFAFALILIWLQQKNLLATDTLLGILAHAALSIGLIAFSLLEQQADLYAYLFGDILTITADQLWWIYGAAAATVIILLFNWPALVLMAIDENLARAENINTRAIHLLLIFLMTIIVAISIQIVGILLITSMLIIPAAAARQLVKSPEAMAIIAALLGVCAVFIGIYASLLIDTPSGPSIVAAATALFVFSIPIAYFFSRTP